MDDPTTAWMGEHHRVGAGGVVHTALPAPEPVWCDNGIGQVTIRWTPVPEAAGYVVFRAPDRDGPYAWVDHHGGDIVKAVPGPLYLDSTGEPGKRYWYAVASVQAPDREPGPLSPPVAARSLTEGIGQVNLMAQVDQMAAPIRPVWRMLGSEHLALLESTDRVGDIAMGPDLAEALTIASQELGCQAVRAHGIFLDDLHIIEDGAKPAAFQFEAVDRLYDALLARGLKPVVELSFMPKAFASDPRLTVFEYRGHIAKPTSWADWSALVTAFCQHLVNRYGLDLVRTWGFEVWNEPNLEAFWQHSFADYMTLYAVTVDAVKGVDPTLRVGGPATAATGWLDEFLQYVEANALPLDFISTHLYGALPLDLRPLLQTHQRSETEVWWTEWGVTPTHFAPINDAVFGAPFILHGMKRVQANAQYLAYWVVSDQFEELGRAPRLFHGGFGLLTIGNLRKPRFWALKLLEAVGLEAVHSWLSGDGAYGLVDAWVTRKLDGSVDVLAWNGTLNQEQRAGHRLLNRHLHLELSGLPARAYQVSVARVDASHSNILYGWDTRCDWPTAEQWRVLRAQDRLHEVFEAEPRRCIAGQITYDADLPMPGVIRVRLSPVSEPLP